MGTILVVEDDVGLNTGIALALGDDRTEVRQVYDLAGARASDYRSDAKYATYTQPSASIS